MFRTPAGQARYFAAYEASLALWPVPVESFDVPTRFGSTHLHACGPASAPPLVLLHGQAISSTMWYPNIAALSQAFRVYAPDTLGDLGKSVSTRPVKEPAEFSDWLSDVFDGLQLERAHVAGLSTGGYAALRFALTAPARVQKLILMSPAGLLPMRAGYFARMALIFLPAPILPLAAKQRLILGTATAAAQPVVQQMMTPTDFRYSMVLPQVCTDAELRQLTMPTLLLVGDRDVVYDQQAMRKRATSLFPNIQVTLIPEGGHALNLDQPEAVNRRVLAFLGAPIN
jgi:pimeloyl-ACP methyl ester carboxylesterase